MASFLLYVSFFALYLLMIWKAEKTYPILFLFLFTYFIQYIFSTYLIYNEYSVLRAEMPITQDRFFDYALPAMISLAIGVLLFNKDVDIRGALSRINPQFASRLGYLLLIVSVTIDGLVRFGVSPLSSIAALTTYLRYPAAFCFLFSSSRIRYLLITLIYLELAAIALRTGVFISFFIWCTYLFFFVCLKFSWSFWLRASFILIAVPLLVIVQSVKKEYRRATWEKQQETGIGLFTDLALESGQDDNRPLSQSSGVVSTVGRLTQGWHLAMTLNYVPRKQGIEHGEEMLSDITASIVPRIVFTDKKIVGSQDKFLKYTGHQLWGSTSMTIGVLGDFYINFGRTGSMIGLFIFGAILASLFFLFMKRYVFLNPIHIVWIPFMLNYLVRANNDFYMVFNCIVKGFLIFLFVNYLSKRLWPHIPRTLPK